MMNISPSDAVQTGKWSGTPVEGSSYTVEQLKGLERRGLSAVVPSRTVRLKKPRERTSAEAMAGIPSSECFYDVEVLCPIIRRPPERDVVLTPGGDEHWMRRP